MPPLADELLLEVLKACADAAPAPLYPGEFATYSGLERGLLDEALDHLRLRGLVQLTDWVQAKGQGYALTPQGELVLQKPTLLGKAQVAPPTPPLVAEVSNDTPWERGEAVRATLINPVRPVVCMTLLAVNLVMFALGMFLAWRQGVDMGEYLGSATRQVNIIRDDLGALNPQEVLLLGQWWRLLSYAFVHGGLIHLLMNMYFLFSLGPLVEQMWGATRFLVLYTVAALVGGCAVMLTLRNAVGASGALCGLLTSLGMWTYLNRHALPPNITSSWLSNVFTNIILMAIISTLPGVSWEGHLGGAIGGALISVPLNWHRYGTGRQRLLGLAGMVAVPVLSLLVVVYAYQDVLTVRHKLYPPFQDAEEKAATVFMEQAMPLLQNWNDDIDQARIAAARTAFTGAQEELRQTLEILDKAGPFRDRHAVEALPKARAYLEEWSKYYALFLETSAAPPPWPLKQGQALSQQMENVARARRPIENAGLMPARYTTKK